MKKKKFSVTVVRTSYSTRDIEVEANDPIEAKNKALDMSGDFEYPERDAEYNVIQMPVEIKE
jgi:hypothetical protein